MVCKGGEENDGMRRNGSKGLAAKGAARAATSGGPKLKSSKTSRAAAQARARRISRGNRKLKELFEAGAEAFKRLDTETIVRIAEDKDLEYV